MQNPEKLALIKRIEDYLDNGINVFHHVEVRNLLFDTNLFLCTEPIDLNDLRLHESIDVETVGKDAPTYWQVMRVEGGWIYTRWDSEAQNYLETSIYVPKR